MKKLFLLATALISFNAFALDQDVMTLVHNKTRETLTDICQEKMKQLTAGTCACLGEKAQANIDDTALGACPNKGAKTCVKKIVEVATIMALSRDSVEACMKQSGQPLPNATSAAAPAPTTQPTTYQPPLSPNQNQQKGID